MNPSEIYAFNFQNPEPKYYTRVPNIIDHLTYKIEKDGIMITKRLSIYAKELYRIIRMIASDSGADWHTTESLAEIIGCSTGSIVNAKKELLMPMDQLDGKSLIIETRKQIHKTVNDKHISTTLCTRMIVDIWKWNNAFMATIKNQIKYGRPPDSRDESANPPDSCDESAPQGPDSYGEPNNNKENNNPLFKEQKPTAVAVPVCSSKEKMSDVNLKAFNWLLKIGCDIQAATHFINTYSTKDISEASKYVEKKYEKNKREKKQTYNLIGYLRKTLENKWWIPKNA